ncbi:MAG TPA: cytochrome bc complex cytochrome b subunit [Pirellulales bacterium]|jgi:ubiquinol-cytochrome c reductase cytochrome b subunit|nr:cytochrome bc complex cytochrome b subunit [Pirellulales bacterium]
MKPLVDWLDDRTGIRGLVHEALYENIPGGARWRYVWGSTLVFAFSVQVITGIFLWMCYSPSGQTAWESVAYVQYEMFGGWLLRGLHHFMAQAMVVLLALHLLQVVIDGAYRAPREVNFWLGLILMQIVLGLSLTGYLLPWDQKGYWATRVATNLMGIVPGVGGQLQQLVVGGADYGHLTLTRFFALHAGVLPGLLVFFLVLHVAIFRRHGIHCRAPGRRPDCAFWPDQVLKDAVACLAVLCVVLFFVFKPAIMGGGLHGARPGDMLGADLGAPADAANPYSAARPEWYFLFLFQFLKYFPGDREIIGAIIVPSIVMLILFLMPLVGRWKLGHVFNICLLCCLLVGAALLTAQAWHDDNQANGSNLAVQLANRVMQPNPKQLEESEGYLEAVEDAEASAHRAVALIRAPEGIPPLGAISLLRRDAKTQGPRIFAEATCTACHDRVDAHGQGHKAAKPSAPNLYGFASRQWLRGLLSPDPQSGISSPRYFGHTSHADGDMAGFVKGDLKKLKPQQIEQIVVALSAEAQLRSQAAEDAKDGATIAAGRKLIQQQCTDCHKFHDAGELGSAPDLTGYGSYEWMLGMISRPESDRFYDGNNDRMPSSAAFKEPERNRLNPLELEMLVHWLRGEWYEPAAPATAQPEAIQAGTK